MARIGVAAELGVAVRREADVVELYFVEAELGGPKRENRRALALMTFIRNAPISMTTASQVFTHDPGVLVMVAVMSALSVVLGVLATVGFRRLGA